MWILEVSRRLRYRSTRWKYLRVLGVSHYYGNVILVNPASIHSIHEWLDRTNNPRYMPAHPKALFRTSRKGRCSGQFDWFADIAQYPFYKLFVVDREVAAYSKTNYQNDMEPDEVKQQRSVHSPKLLRQSLLPVIIEHKTDSNMFLVDASFITYYTTAWLSSYPNYFHDFWWQLLYFWWLMSSSSKHYSYMIGIPNLTLNLTMRQEADKPAELWHRSQHMLSNHGSDDDTEALLADNLTTVKIETLQLRSSSFFKRHEREATSNSRHCLSSMNEIQPHNDIHGLRVQILPSSTDDLFAIEDSSVREGITMRWIGKRTSMSLASVHERNVLTKANDHYWVWRQPWVHVAQESWTEATKQMALFVEWC